MRHRRFNFAQRLVVVSGLGAVFYLIGIWGTSIDSLSGWVGYAPLGSATYGSATSSAFETSTFFGGLHPWVRFVIWLMLIAVWVGISLALLRSPSPSPETTSDEPLK